MAEGIIIRRLTAADDLSVAIHLLQRFFRAEGFDTPDAAIARNAQTMATLEICGLFVAEQNGKTVGVATVSLEFGVEYGWSAEMGDLYVVPEARGQGVSTQLVHAIETFLLSKGAAGYQVTVTPHAAQHHDLTKFYQRLGFDAEGRMILYRRLQV
jgi:GNAT superfamily N-acetyltransferase